MPIEKGLFQNISVLAVQDIDVSNGGTVKANLGRYRVQAKDADRAVAIMGTPTTKPRTIAFIICLRF